MTAVQLYCREGCIGCARLMRLLREGRVATDFHDVTEGSAAFERVRELGYLSLPVLVAPDGTSAAGRGAIEMANRLAKVVAEHPDTEPYRSHPIKKESTHVL